MVSDMYYVKLTSEQQELLDNINKYIKRHFEDLIEDDIFDEDELLADRRLNFVFSGSSNVFQLTSATAGILADLYPMLVNHKVACVYDRYSSTYTITVAKGLWWDAFEVDMEVEGFVKHMLSSGVLNFRNKPKSWIRRVVESVDYECEVPARSEYSPHGRPARRRKQKQK